MYFIWWHGEILTYLEKFCGDYLWMTLYLYDIGKLSCDVKLFYSEKVKAIYSQDLHPMTTDIYLTSYPARLLLLLFISV